MKANQKNQPIVFLDSGIGGIPYCRHFMKHNPDETVCYFADRLNFPYGNRSREELAAILISLMEKLIIQINPKITVLACNTASVSALTELRSRFTEHLFVGTVPAIKPAMQASKTNIVGVLGTARTIADPYIKALAGDNCAIYGIAAPELVEFVELRFMYADKNEKQKMARQYIQRFKEAGADTLVLGCTHFLFLLEEFKSEAAPFINVFDSIQGITRRIESLLDNGTSLLRADKRNADTDIRGSLLLSGSQAPDSFWENIAKELELSVSLFAG